MTCRAHISSLRRKYRRAYSQEYKTNTLPPLLRQRLSIKNMSWMHYGYLILVALQKYSALPATAVPVKFSLCSKKTEPTCALRTSRSRPYRISTCIRRRRLQGVPHWRREGVMGRCTTRGWVASRCLKTRLIWLRIGHGSMVVGVAVDRLIVMHMRVQMSTGRRPRSRMDATHPCMAITSLHRPLTSHASLDPRVHIDEPASRIQLSAHGHGHSSSPSFLHRGSASNALDLVLRLTYLDPPASIAIRLPDLSFALENYNAEFVRHI